MAADVVRSMFDWAGFPDGAVAARFYGEPCRSFRTMEAATNEVDF